jgi:hypothetical protein
MRSIVGATAAVLGLGVVATRAPAGEPTAPAPLTARVDPRVELVSTVFRLAGNPEWTQGAVPRYSAAVDAHFGKFRDHAVVRHAAALRRQHGVSFDAVAGFAVHLDDAFRLVVPAAKAADLDARWPPAEAEAFAGELRAFAKDADAAGFFRSQRELYDLTAKRLQALLDAKVEVAWFDRFFGARPRARFALEVGLLSGGGSYGPSVRRPDGTEELHCILGVWATDDDGKPVFADEVAPYVVHEFCHSYCNPIVDAHAAELLPAGRRLWRFVAEAMGAQAYGEPITMLRESLVRACVVRWTAATQGEEAAKREVADQEGRSFLWTEALARALSDYESLRAENPTLDRFVPAIARVLEAAAADLETRDAGAPHVVAMTPRNGATDVDPATTAIVVAFDRAMTDGSWAVVGGGPHFPEVTGSPSYDAAHKVLTIPVRLKPSWDYELWLNRGQFDTFRSEQGVRLAPVRVTFATRGG